MSFGLKGQKSFFIIIEFKIKFNIVNEKFNIDDDILKESITNPTSSESKIKKAKGEQSHDHYR